MNEWMETFIAQCLADVPWGKYRQRTEKELRDHMETQYQVLTEGGMPPSEARGKILKTMGDPERLREEYKTAWERTLQGRWALRPRLAGPFIGVCLITAHLWVFTTLLLGRIGFDRYSGPLCLRDPLCNFIYCMVMILVPTTLGAVFLRFCFRKTRRPAPWITLGLLTAWTGEKTYLFLEAAWRHVAHRYRGSITLQALVREGRWCLGDYSYLWQGVVYVLASFIGCLVLGQLFGRKNEGRHELV